MDMLYVDLNYEENLKQKHGQSTVQIIKTWLPHIFIHSHTFKHDGGWYWVTVVS